MDRAAPTYEVSSRKGRSESAIKSLGVGELGIGFGYEV